MLCPIQDVSVVDQEKIDKLMLDMDGTENKCKTPLNIEFPILSHFSE